MKLKARCSSTTKRVGADCLRRAEVRPKRGKSFCGVYLPHREQPRPLTCGWAS
jgi:hypothetical protein